MKKTTELINCFYLGTKTIDFSISIKVKKDGVIVNCSEYNLKDEFFHVSSAREFIESYKDDYLNSHWIEGENYEIIYP